MMKAVDGWELNNVAGLSCSYGTNARRTTNCYHNRCGLFHEELDRRLPVLITDVETRKRAEENRKSDPQWNHLVIDDSNPSSYYSDHESQAEQREDVTQREPTSR
jgi:hypothetical protein